MKVEVVTAKRSLTKALLNQMKSPSTKALKDGVVLGYVIGIVKNSYRAILIRYMEEYFVISDTWKRGQRFVYRDIKKGSQSRRFSSVEKCGDWWSAYQSVLIKATTQIYI